LSARRRSPAFHTLVCLALLVATVKAEAQECPPPITSVRADEDYSCLLGVTKPRGWAESIKVVPLSSTLNASFGGEVRLRYDYQHNPAWGQDPQDEHGAFLQRYLLHADARADSGRFRVFTQLRSAFEQFRKAGPSPVEEGELELQQMFADLALVRNDDASLGVRLGRQEFRLGSERLVSLREGPNVRRRFDGARAMLVRGNAEIDTFALYLTENEPGSFEDGTNDNEALWGVYGAIPNALRADAGIDLYYLGHRNEFASYATVSGEETRHTIGARLWGNSGQLDWNWESIYQFGRIGRLDVTAWSIATDTGYSLDGVVWQPRFGISANIASGDSNPDDQTLETFNPLFPRGPYFDELSLLGPRNFFNVHPSLALRPHREVTLTADIDFYWRLEREDGVYDPAGHILRSGAGSRARYVSTLMSMTGTWQVNRNLELSTVYTHVFPGEFIRDTGSHDAIDFIELTARLQF
jgi:hypothetical protein